MLRRCGTGCRADGRDGRWRRQSPTRAEAGGSIGCATGQATGCAIRRSSGCSSGTGRTGWWGLPDLVDRHQVRTVRDDRRHPQRLLPDFRTDLIELQDADPQIDLVDLGTVEVIVGLSLEAVPLQEGHVEVVGQHPVDHSLDESDQGSLGTELDVLLAFPAAPVHVIGEPDLRRGDIQGGAGDLHQPLVEGRIARERGELVDGHPAARRHQCQVAPARDIPAEPFVKELLVLPDILRRPVRGHPQQGRRDVALGEEGHVLHALAQGHVHDPGHALEF